MTWTVVAALLLTVGIVVAQVTPNLSEFQVNSETAYSQQHPAVAALPNGTFVVVWQSADYTYPVGTRLVAQRYDADGGALGSEFVIAEITEYGLEHTKPEVDATAANEFVVAWQRKSNYDTPPLSVRAQKFSSTGMPVTGETVVASGPGHLDDPDVAVMSDGDFVVVWAKPYTGPAPGNLDLGTIYGHRFDASGSPVAIEFRVDGQAGQERQNSAPAITEAGSGGFVVAWESDPQSGAFEEGDVFARRFGDPITAQGDEIQVNPADSGPQLRPDITTLTVGEFVVVWDSYYWPYGDILGRRIESGYSGLATVGNQFAVNTAEYDRFDVDPAVDTAPSGQFIVVWSRDDFFSNDPGIVGRVMNANGTKDGSEFVANTGTGGPFGTRNQNNPAAAINPGSRFLTAWDSENSTGDDSDDTSIAAALYSLDLIFADPFESGDVSAWSSSVP